MRQIRLMKPYVNFNEVEEDFRAIFDSGIFTRGQHAAAFRKELAEYTGAKHVHLATSATTALWVCLKLLGVGAGDEVVVSDFSFPATANVVEDVGAIPVFADVSRETYNVLPETVEGLLTVRTKAVIFVDALGNPSGLHSVVTLCRSRGIPVIEDAACAIGSSERGRRCGSIADLTCLSFHPRKLLSTGEGGAILTDVDKWSYWLDVKLAHGSNGMNGPGQEFVDFGYNFRLAELQAAMGRKQLAKIDAIVHDRLQTREIYREILEPLGFTAQSIGTDVRYNAQSITFSVPANCNRNGLISALKTFGIETTIGTYALSGTTYYWEKYHAVNANSRWLANNTISLPCYAGVDVYEVCEAVRSITN
jgi:dTDP-4-amino-4,6-dideoxygalactose transaminase